MRISVVGPPGSGKTTQAKMLARKLFLSYVSISELIKKAGVKDIKLGRQVRLTLEEGKLVDDDLILKLFLKRVGRKDCQRGFVVDGAPRTHYQVRKIEERLPFDKVIFVKTPFNVAKERLLRRGRADDTGEAIMRRFQLYKESSHLVLEFYRKGGKLIEVDGDRPLEKTAAEILERIGYKG